MTLTKILRAASALSDIDRDDILERVGLARRRSFFEKAITTLGIFGAGMVVGAGVGMLASPVAPEDVRKKIGEGVRTVKNELNELVSHETNHAASGLGESRNTPKTGAIKNGATL